MNIKFTAFISAVAVTCGFCVGAAYADESTTKATKTTKIMCIGDSITDGYGTDGSYRKFLYHNLTEAGYSIDMVGPNWSWGDSTYTDEETGDSFTYDAAHCGYSGYAIENYSGRNGILETIESGNYLAEYSPDIVILQIGTNDVIDNHELDSADERLETLVEYIVENISSDSDIFVTTIPDLDPNRSDVYSWFGNYRHSSDWQTTYTDDEVEISVDEAVTNYNKTVKSVVEKINSEGKTNVHFADVNSAVTDVKTQLKDGVHPNNTGYKLMGNYWTEVIEAFLTKEETTDSSFEMTTEMISEIESETDLTTDISEETSDIKPTETETVAEETYTTETSTDITETLTETTEFTEPTEPSEDIYIIPNVADVVSLQRYILKIDTTITSSNPKLNLDRNGDGKINIIDLALLKEAVFLN